MGKYQARLDRIEAAIGLQDDFHVLLVLDAEANEQALAGYAEQRGIRPTEVRGTLVYLNDEDARLL